MDKFLQHDEYGNVINDDSPELANDYSKKIMNNKPDMLNSIFGVQNNNSNLDFLKNIVPQLNPNPENATYPNSPMDPLGQINNAVIDTPAPPPSQLKTMNDASSAMKDLGLESVPAAVNPSNMTDQEMKDAIAERQRNLAMTMIMEGGNQIGSGLLNVKNDPHFADNLKELAGLPVKNIKDLRSAEMEKLSLDKNKQLADPNSETSKLVRNNMKNMLLKMGYKDLAGKISDGMSADVIQSTLGGVNMQNLMSHYETEQRKRDEMQLRRDMKLEEIKNKLDDKDMKALQTAGKLATAEINRNNTAFGKNANILRSAVAMETLVGGANPNDLTSQQVTELAKNLDAMLSSGAATVSGTKDLIPRSAMGDAKKIESYIRNIPKGAQQGAFVKLIIETVQREKEVAQKQIEASQKRIFAPYINTIRRHPNEFRDIANLQDLDPTVTDSLLGIHSNETKVNVYPPNIENGIRSFMQAHPELNRDQAIDVLKKAGKIK